MTDNQSSWQKRATFKLKKIIFAMVSIGLLAGVLGAGAWFFSGSSVSTESTARIVYDRRPTVMEVAPPDMHQAYLRQYRLNPDRRVVGAFRYLVQVYNRNKIIKSLAFDMQPSASKKDPLVLILKNGFREAGRIQLPLPLTFSSVVDSLIQWIDLLNQTGGTVKQTRTVYPGRLQAAVNKINYVDQRKVISALVDLEGMWQDTHDPAILKCAVRAYGLLLLGLIPDKMDESDALASCALAYLGMAKNMNPELAMGQEEALLAMTMGYRKHAGQVLAYAPVSNEYADKCMRAYLEDDFNGLKEINKQEWHVLGHYLLSRTYRNLGLYKQAEEENKKLLSLFPASYPNLVELIYSSSVGLSKVLTYVFPLELLRMMEVSLMQEPDFESQTWQDRVSAVAGEQGAGISLSGFEDMLGKWQPLSGQVQDGFLISSGRVRSVFRILYANSLYLRFDLLFNRWAVLDKTGVFVDNLMKNDAGHPMVMSMLAGVLVKQGRRDQAQEIVEKLLLQTDCPPDPAVRMYYLVTNLRMKDKLLPSLAGLLDSRPGYSYSLAYFLQANYRYDQALDLYRQVIANNPYTYWAYSNMALVAGSDQPVLDAVEAMDGNYAILAKAGGYFWKKDTPDSLKRALSYYEQAISLLPDKYHLYEDKAVILRRLENYEAALATMRPFVDKYKDLTDVFVRSNMARTYLAMGDTKNALRIMGNAAESYQGGAMLLTAEINIVEGKKDKAEEMIEKALKRYPFNLSTLSYAAAFYWNNDQPGKAVQLIAQGAKIASQHSTWFFKKFFDVFAEQPNKNIIKAVSLLQEAGIDNWQIAALAWRFAWRDRFDVAFKIMKRIKEKKLIPRLKHQFSMYRILRQWKGDEEARQWLKKQIPPHKGMMAGMVIINRGEFHLMDDFVSPEKASSADKEFYWLMSLVGWLGADKQPASSAARYEKHYQGESADYYFAIGQFLMGIKEESALLDLIENDKQRCEFPYYIGLKYRLAGDFRRAAEWYGVCIETLLDKNGEYNWARDELFWWAKTGIERRHRLLPEDMAFSRKKDIEKENQGN